MPSIRGDATDGRSLRSQLHSFVRVAWPVLVVLAVVALLTPLAASF